MIEAKIKKQISKATASELSAMKAEAAEVLLKDSSREDAKEIIDAINEELETRAKDEPADEAKPVRVKANNFVLVDGRPWEKDQEGSVTAKQYAALAWNFTRLAALALLALLLCNGSAMAQTYKLTTLSSSLMTNRLTAATTTTALLGPTNAVAKWEEEALMIRLQCDAACNSNMTFGVVRTIDGTNFETTASLSLAVPMNGTTEVWWGTNLTRDYLGGWAGWKFKSAANPHATANATNVLVQTGQKPVRFGP